MADPELSGDVAGPDPLVGHVNDPLSHHVGQGPSVYEHAT